MSNNIKPTETLSLESGLSLAPRFKLNLTIHRSDATVKPLDEWQLKTSLTTFIKSSFSVTIQEQDLIIRKYKDVKKRKRDDPVARGCVFFRELGFLSGNNGGDEEKKVSEWKKKVVEKMDGIELSLVGVKFKLSVEVPKSDDFDAMRKEWEEGENALSGGDRGYSRGRKREPDTIVLRGVPSRWFAETRVSSKPSMLVTHTIFSALGKIRNLDVSEDDGIGKDADEEAEDIVPGLQCKIVVRFEDHKEFSKALKVLCGRSLQKEGSRLKADYEVSWDKDGIFSRRLIEENSRSIPKVATGGYRSEVGRYESRAPRFSESNARSKRFKE
uniref:A-kinase anchor protein 17B n=1 Tax=Erigeron canadensis TaxID=72917 RepID=UPI001CB978A2|nr:A-kinase anchor protein 17B [Erigeron canadensis]